MPRRREPHRPPAVLQRAPPPHTPRRPANLRRRGADKSPLTAAAARTPSLPLVAPPAAARGEEPIRDRCCCLGCRRLSRPRTPLATLYAAPTTLGGLWFTRPVQGGAATTRHVLCTEGAAAAGTEGPSKAPWARQRTVASGRLREGAPQSHIMGGVNNTPKIRPLAFWLLSGHHTPPHVCFDRPMAQCRRRPRWPPPAAPLTASPPSRPRSSAPCGSRLAPPLPHPPRATPTRGTPSGGAAAGHVAPRRRRGRRSPRRRGGGLSSTTGGGGRRRRRRARPRPAGVAAAAGGAAATASRPSRSAPRRAGPLSPRGRRRRRIWCRSSRPAGGLTLRRAQTPGLPAGADARVRRRRRRGAHPKRWKLQPRAPFLAAPHPPRRLGAKGRYRQPRWALRVRGRRGHRRQCVCRRGGQGAPANKDCQQEAQNFRATKRTPKLAIPPTSRWSRTLRVTTAAGRSCWLQRGTPRRYSRPSSLP